MEDNIPLANTRRERSASVDFGTKRDSSDKAPPSPRRRHRRVVSVDFPEFNIDANPLLEETVPTVPLEETPWKRPSEESDSWRSHAEQQARKRVTWRHHYRAFVLRSTFGKLLNALQILLSLFSVILYVWQTYLYDEPQWMIWTELTIAILFIYDYVQGFIIAPHKLKFVLSLTSAVDVLTILPVFFQLISPTTFVYFRVVRVLRLMRLLRTYRLFVMAVNVVQRQLFGIAFTVICLVFIATGLINLIETDDNGNPYPFHTSFYFIMVTVATVGYGDIVPRTDFGRLVITLLLLVAAVLLPYELNQLIDAFKSVATTSEGEYQRRTKHVVICGSITIDVLKDFLNEFYHQCRADEHINIVVLSQTLTNTDLNPIMVHPKFEDRITFLRGSAMLSTDLKRCKAREALAFFIVSNPYAENPDAEDKGTLLKTLSIKKFSPRAKIYVQLINPENKSHIQRVGVTDVFSIFEFKLGLLAKSLLYPGISTLICNLVRTQNWDEFNKEGRAYHKYQPQSWQTEYLEGRDHQLYEFKFTNAFVGQTFSDVTTYIYKRWNCILFGLEVVSESPYIALNPGNKYTIKGGEIGYIISGSAKVVQEVANYELLDQQAIVEEEPEAVRRVAKSPSFYKALGDLGFHEASQDNRFRQTHHMSTEKAPLLVRTSVNYSHMEKALEKHIIICGSTSDLFYLISPLRSRNLETIRDIVILHHTAPSEFEWNQIAYFPGVHFVMGTPLSYYDLQRAGVERAYAVLIRASEQQTQTEYMQDAESILASVNIELNQKRKLHVVVELVSDNNIKFLSSATQHDRQQLHQLRKDKFMEDAYASGSVYASSLLNTLLCQAFFRPSIITIIKLWVAYEINDVNTQSLLFQIKVHPAFVGLRMGDLFPLLEQNNLLLLGLFRQPEIGPSYVLTCPKPNVIIGPKDRFFVLVPSTTSVPNSFGVEAEVT